MKLKRKSLKHSKLANPTRVTGYEEQSQMPNIFMVRRLAERHSLTLRSTMEISKGRQVIKTNDIYLLFLNNLFG